MTTYMERAAIKWPAAAVFAVAAAALLAQIVWNWEYCW